MFALKKSWSLLLTAVLAASTLVFASPAQAYATNPSALTGATYNTFTAPAAPNSASISNSQRFDFQYPGGVFEVGAPTAAATSIAINAYKDGGLDTGFNGTGSVTFTSQVSSANRTMLYMSTYASGSKWAVLDNNGFPSQNNYLYLGTFSGGFQSTITLPTTNSLYTSCVSWLSGYPNLTVQGGEFKFVPNVGFAAPLLQVNCSAYVTANGSTYSQTIPFLFTYSGGTTLGTAATLTSFTSGTTSPTPVSLLNTTTKKSITHFGVSVNPSATGSQIALTFLDATVNGLSYSSTGDYDPVSYTDYIVTRVTAAGVVTQTTSAWTGVTAGTRTGTVFVMPINNGTVYALQHASDGTNSATRILTFASSGAAATPLNVTGLTLTASVDRVAPVPSQGTTLKFAALADGSPSYYFEVNATTGVGSLLSTFTTSGGYYMSDLLWAMADDSTGGADFYARSSSTSIIRIAATGAPAAPSAPAAPTGFALNKSIQLNWTTPVNGGSPITSYTIQLSSDNGYNWTTYLSNTLVLSTTITGLTNGNSYIARISATNAVGTSAWSSTSPAFQPEPVPDTSTILSVTTTSTSATLTYTAAADNGSPITDYQIEFSSDGGVTWNAAGGSHTGLTQTVLGLTHNASYTFKIRAGNQYGYGAWVVTPSAYQIASPPLQPAAPTGTAGISQVSLTWVAPSSTDCAITRYEVDYSTDSGMNWTMWANNVATTSTVVTPLNNGGSYQFRVTAQNCAGWGVASAASVTLYPNPAPAAPTGDLTVTGAGSNAVNLSWAPVTSTPSVTDYQVEYSTNGGSSWTTYVDGVSSTPTASVTGLTAGLSYVFRVSGINTMGVGSPSASSSPIISGAVPSSVTSAPVVSAVAGSATLTWVLPSNGGSALTLAELQYSSNGGSTWVNYSGSVGLTGTVSITGLTAGQTYVFRTRADNFFGVGGWSAASNSVTFLAATAPSAITGFTAILNSSSQIDLAWNVPNANGSAITDYTVEFSVDGGTTWHTYSHLATTANSMSLTGLTAGLTYTMRVSAMNGIGSSASTVCNPPVTIPNLVADPASTPKIDLGSNATTVNDGKLTIKGENLADVNSVALNNQDSTILITNANVIVVQIPETIAGWVDVKMNYSTGSITFDHLIYIDSQASATVSKLRLGFKSFSNTKMLASSQLRLLSAAPYFRTAISATCIAYAPNAKRASFVLKRAQAACALIGLHIPHAKLKVAVTRSSVKALVVVLFNY